MRNGFRIALAVIVLSTGFLAGCTRGSGPAGRSADFGEREAAP